MYLGDTIIFDRSVNVYVIELLKLMSKETKLQRLNKNALVKVKDLAILDLQI